MRKAIIIIILGIVSLSVLVFTRNNDTAIDKKWDDGEIVRPEFVTSMSEIDESLPTVLMFKAPGCDSCVKMEVIYKRLHEELEGKFNIVYYDAYEFTNLEVQNAIDKYEATVAPTTIIMRKDKSLVTKIEGITTEEKIKEYLKEAGISI